MAWRLRRGRRVTPVVSSCRRCWRPWISRPRWAWAPSASVSAAAPRATTSIWSSNVSATSLPVRDDLAWWARSPIRVRRSGFDSQQGNALHAKLLARTLRVVGDELILRIALHRHETQSRSLDHPAIIVMLRRASDAGSPERGVADDAFRQLHVGDDVRDREPAAGFEQTCGFAKHLRFVGRKIDDAVADHDICQAARQRSFLDIALDVSHIAESVAVAQPLRLRALLVGHINADDLPAGPHLQRGNKGVHTRTAAEIDNGFARLGIRQMKVVADTRERLDRFRRYAVEVRRRVAETFGHRTAHLEVELAARILGDAAVHRLHLGLQLLRIEPGGRGHVSLSRENQPIAAYP